VGKYFVLDDGRVLVDEDVFDGKRGDLREEYATKSVGYRGINSGK
jgi:hypothetical protein